MIRPFDVQQPFPQDPPQEPTRHVVFLEDLGVL